MKKIAIIFLLTIYTLSVCGISINRFYCCGSLQSTGISSAIFSNENKKDDGCCRHTQTIIKISDSHDVATAAHIALVNTGYPAGCSFGNTINGCFLHAYLAGNSSFSNGPPFKPLSNPLYIQFCSYRI